MDWRMDVPPNRTNWEIFEVPDSLNIKYNRIFWINEFSENPLNITDNRKTTDNDVFRINFCLWQFKNSSIRLIRQFVHLPINPPTSIPATVSKRPWIQLQLYHINKTNFYFDLAPIIDISGQTNKLTFKPFLSLQPLQPPGFVLRIFGFVLFVTLLAGHLNVVIQSFPAKLPGPSVVRMQIAVL